MNAGKPASWREGADGCHAVFGLRLFYGGSEFALRIKKETRLINKLF
jgi:hypothetical protein